MIEAIRRDGACYVSIAGNSPIDQDNVYAILRRHGSYRFDAKSLSWQVSEPCFAEVTQYLAQTGEVGSRLKLPLFPYQKETAAFCLEKEAALIVLPCGTGKTPIGISLYLDAKARHLIDGPGLVVVKATLKTQWSKEVEKFSDLRAKILDTEKATTASVTGKIRRRQKKLDELLVKIPTPSITKDIKALTEELNLLQQESEKAFQSQFDDADLYIANYETLRDSAVRKELHKRKLGFIFADECHYIKNASSARAKALCEFATVPMRFGATATPIQKNPEDAYSIMKFIRPTLFPSHSQFCGRYLRYSGYGIVCGSRNEKELRNKLSPFMIVKTKEETSSNLPDVVPITRYCNMDPKQIAMTNQLLEEIKELKAQQEQLVKGFKDPTKAKEDETVAALNAHIVARQTFAQELADSETLLSSSDSELAQQYVTGAKTNAKLDLLVDLLEEIISSGEKACIFSKYKRMQDVITIRLQKEPELKDVKIAYVNGALSSERRYEETYTKFRDNPEYKILLMSDAGAEGVNLSKARYLIEYEPADSYLVQTQRRGRIERADSVHDTVFVYQLVAEKSYDEIALKVIAKKEKYDAVIIKGVEEETNGIR